MLLIVSRYFTPKGYSGITIFPFIIISDRKYRSDAILIRHEKIHIRQQIELAVFPFFIWYFVEFVIRLVTLRDRKAAYKSISFEREAYDNQENPSYLKTRPVWNFLRYL